MSSAVIITHAPKLNYMHNYAVLPLYYGTEKYFSRPDVKAIRETVKKNLDELNAQTGFAKKFKGRKVLIKPNLVGVMYKCGYKLDEIPETTDPRVFDAVVSYLSELDCKIAIVESSGGGSTMQFMKDNGMYKIAKYYGTEIYALEEQPLDHYYVPKAEVQKEVFLPRILSEVVRGEALYVSVPKMKTNLYTGVTLGFKNAMGTLPMSMRYRNHTWQINKKLVDLLYLFKPDLTVIDGIIGGEGLTPGPVDPVKVGVVLSSDNSVECDRVATRMMVFDPEQNQLMIEAVKRNFGDPEVRVFGKQTVTQFRPAEATFYSERFRKNWPDVKLYVGFTNKRAPKIMDINMVSRETVLEMEQVCTGGCLATAAMYMETLYQAKKEQKDVKAAVILGNGVEFNGKHYWFDYDGKAYDSEKLKALPVRKIGLGSCADAVKEICDSHGGGCCRTSEISSVMQKGTKTQMPMLSMDNETFLNIMVGMFNKYFAIKKIIKQGDIVNIDFDATDDRIFEIPQLSEQDMQKDWIAVPMPKLNSQQIKANMKKLKMFEV